MSKLIEWPLRQGWESALWGGENGKKEAACAHLGGEQSRPQDQPALRPSESVNKDGGT